MPYSRLQRTIRQPVAVEGFGYWSGKDVRVEFRPAAVGTGIVFVREDLGPEARVPARVEYRTEVPRRTNLQFGAVQVGMVEHIMAALSGLDIDNCEIGVSEAEMPGCDGSALAFVRALDSVGTVDQDEEISQIIVTETVRLTSGDSWIEARPTFSTSYRVEFDLDYPSDSIIGRQSMVVDITPESFRKEIAPCRTFVLKKEADEMIRLGLGTRVSPQDLLVFDERGPIENELRFSNECARHKTLDLIGDLALMGCKMIGHIVAYRSGHRLNTALAHELVVRFADIAPMQASA